MIAQLLQALERVQQEASVKVLMLSGIERCFARRREKYNEAVDKASISALVCFSLPGDRRPAGRCDRRRLPGRSVV